MSDLKNQPASWFGVERPPETKKQRHLRQKNEWARRRRLQIIKDREQLEKDVQIKTKINGEHNQHIKQLRKFKNACIKIIQHHDCMLKMSPPIPCSKPRRTPLSPRRMSSNAATSGYHKNTGNRQGNRGESPPVQESRAFKLCEACHYPVRSASLSARVTKEEMEEGEEEACSVVGVQTNPGDEDDCCRIDGPLPRFTYSDTEAAASLLLQLLDTDTPGASGRNTSSVLTDKPEPSIARDHMPKTSTTPTYEPKVTTAKSFEPKSDVAMVYEPQMGTKFSYPSKSDFAVTGEPDISYATMSVGPKAGFAVTGQSRASSAVTSEPWQSSRPEQRHEPDLATFSWQERSHCQTSSLGLEDFLCEPLTQKLPDDINVMMSLYGVRLK